MSKKIIAILERIEAKLEEHDARFRNIDERFHGIDEKFHDVNRTLHVELNRIYDRFEQQDQKIGQRFDEARTYAGLLHDQLRGDFRAFRDELANHEARITRLEKSA
jgi:hypothetical protein